MTFRTWIALMSMAVASVFATTVQSAEVTLRFDASLMTGSLAGARFPGTVAYNPAGGTGVGEEFFTLTELDFTLLGATFTRADLSQGGQMITENGVPSYFTGAFFPPPPDNSPVGDIAFGFGGPGIIGYSTPAGFGDGKYVLVAVPEPASLALLVVGFAAMAGIAKATRLSGGPLGA